MKGQLGDQTKFLFATRQPTLNCFGHNMACHQLCQQAMSEYYHVNLLMNSYAKADPRYFY